MSPLDSSLNRRRFLCVCGAALLAPEPLSAGEKTISVLIEKTKEIRPISKRIEAISRALLKTRYQANTLIGGPRKREVFITRDDRFDCVTFCETVLAAARARDLPAFEAQLKAIRYRDGLVEWRERNHDFAIWCERNIANGVCRPVELGGTVEVTKSLVAPRALGKRHYTIAGVPSGHLVTDKDALQDGDIVGFVSRRSSLDYFHTGFVMHGAKGDVLLRHASESHGRVIDERMAGFLAVNRPDYVTVLRPQEAA